MTYLTEKEIEAELSNVSRPPAFEHELGYPFNGLGDRQFEFLLHDIYKADAAEGKCDGQFDDVMLMQGVGERGRDCVLLKQGKPVGVVQCKKYESSITRPAAAREIIKFVLHAITSPELMPDANGFIYVFAVSRDFNEKAKDLLFNFNDAILKDPNLEAWVAEVIEENKSLEKLTYGEISAKLHEILKKIQLVPLNANDINSKLVGRNAIIQKFFTVKKVIAEESLYELKEMMNVVLKQSSDEDVSRLLEIFKMLPKDRRFDIGSMSFWGYPQSFLDSLVASKQLGPILLQFAGAKGQLDAAFFNYLFNSVRDEVDNRIVVPKLASPFTIQAALPYVMGKLAKSFVEKVNGKIISKSVPKGIIAYDVLSLRKRLLEVGEKVLKNDFSGFLGSAEQVKAKVGLARIIHADFKTVEEMDKKFDEDWPKIASILDDIVSEVEKRISDGPAVVVRSLDWLDDQTHVKTVLAALGAYDKKRKDNTH